MSYLKVIASVKELNALPDGSIIIDRYGDGMQYRGGLWCQFETQSFGSEWIFKKYSPLLLVHRGDS